MTLDSIYPAPDAREETFKLLVANMYAQQSPCHMCTIVYGSAKMKIAALALGLIADKADAER